MKEEIPKEKLDESAILIADARREIVDILVYNQLPLKEVAVLFGIILAPGINNMAKETGRPNRTIRKEIVEALDATIRSTISEMQKEEWKRGMQ